MYISPANIVIAGRASSRTGTGPRHTSRARPRAGSEPHDDTCASCRANAAEARRIADSLDALVWDGTPIPPAARIVAAQRLFSEGNGYLTGQIIDRSA